MQETKKIRILSLDGGGIRGIISCVVLQYLEQLLQKEDPEAKIGDYFDLIAGSSTGGIIAAIVLVPGADHKSKFSIDTALSLYAERGYDIFKVSTWSKIWNPFGLLDERISAKNLERQLLDFFEDLRLSELCKPCLITAYDLFNRKAVFFNSHTAKDPMRNFYVKDVCRATSAAPTYFEPARIFSEFGKSYDLIDGGVYANNPALCAYAEARKIPFSQVLNDPKKPDYPTAKDILLVSVGTGAVDKPYLLDRLKKKGKIGWISPLIDILLSANVETVDYQCEALYQSLGTEGNRLYYRLTPGLHKADGAMDNSKAGNITALMQAALAYIQQNQKTLELLASELRKNH